MRIGIPLIPMAVRSWKQQEEHNGTETKCIGHRGFGERSHMMPLGVVLALTDTDDDM